MDKKTPVIITCAVIGTLIVILAIAFGIKSCQNADTEPLDPTASVTGTVVSGSDVTGPSDGSGADVSDPTDGTTMVTDSEGHTIPIQTEEGEIIITENPAATTAGGNTGSNTPTPAQGQPTDPTQQTLPSQEPTLPTDDGVIELPFVPADAL